MRKHARLRGADKITRKIKGGRWLDAFGRGSVPSRAMPRSAKARYAETTANDVIVRIENG
jgi:hypothetical protein